MRTIIMCKIMHSAILENYLKIIFRKPLKQVRKLIGLKLCLYNLLETQNLL